MAIKFTETKKNDSNAETKGAGNLKTKGVAKKKPAAKRGVSKGKTSIKKA
ncbi:hypothetical protein UFOVP46_19 [uncultured Caudovirales phage]|uniref:Uncharacterized protein n=1 Tax=uncultured Caudovirales phage TaxID=2100421 RepID=A0A6J5KQD1_9CAUD|nr:hypothetical protein UFOVP46_19 [uncultured Caudovirales phage]